MWLDNIFVARSRHTTTLLANGTVLITGGTGFAPFQFGTRTPPAALLGSAELFVPGIGSRD